MKTYRKLIMLLLAVVVLGIVPATAQNFQGEATYHSASKVQLRMGNGEDQMEITEEMQQQINKAMQKEYTLKFNVSESTWKEVESLDGAPTAASSGGVMFSFASSGGGLLYKNTAEGRYQEESSVFGKPFLVKDNLETLEWELSAETKKIGGYNCQKATYSRIVQRRSFSFGGDDEENKGMQTTSDTLTVTAWYTPDIPVTHGPDEYWGLPGLILEVNNGSTTLVCSKVVLNPADGIKIDKPSKGKVVTKAEFDKIQEEKLKEMTEKYSNGNGGIVIKSGNH